MIGDHCFLFGSRAAYLYARCRYTTLWRRLQPGVRQALMIYIALEVQHETCNSIIALLANMCCGARSCNKFDAVKRKQQQSD